MVFVIRSSAYNSNNIVYSSILASNGIYIWYIPEVVGTNFRLNIFHDLAYMCMKTGKKIETNWG